MNNFFLLQQQQQSCLAQLIPFNCCQLLKKKKIIWSRTFKTWRDGWMNKEEDFNESLTHRKKGKILCENFSIKIVKSTHCRSKLQNFPFFAFIAFIYFFSFTFSQSIRVERETWWWWLLVMVVGDVRNPSKAISNFNLNLKSHFSFHIRFS